MLLREIGVPYSQSLTKSINMLGGQSQESLNIKDDGTQIIKYALKT
jgi:hypothetical protein